jgi:hypothetical protein
MIDEPYKPYKAALRKAIQINSTLWGGTFNPIIPLYAQPPKAWKDYPNHKILAEDRVAGYIRAFDPDFLVDCMRPRRMAGCQAEPSGWGGLAEASNDAIENSVIGSAILSLKYLGACTSGHRHRYTAVAQAVIRRSSKLLILL